VAPAVSAAGGVVWLWRECATIPPVEDLQRLMDDITTLKKLATALNVDLENLA
jgi:hypothetical protein